MLLDDVLVDPDYEWTEAQRLGGFRTIGGVPMLSDGDVIGVISLWRQRVDPFTAREIDVALAFAAQGAIAIRNANLMQQLELRSRELAHSVEELQGLHEVGEAVNSSLDLHEVLSTIVAHAVQLSGTEGGSIFEFDAEAQEFSIRAAFGTSEELLDALRAARIGLDDTLVGQAASTRRSLAVADIGDATLDAHLTQLLRAGWRSMLAVPLVREAEILGALVVRRRRPEPSLHDHRPGGDVRKPVGGCDRPCTALSAAGGQEPRARGGEPAQVGVPRKHVPRAADSAQRRDRLFGRAARSVVRRPHAEAGGVPRGHQGLGSICSSC